MLKVVYIDNDLLESTSLPLINSQIEIMPVNNVDNIFTGLDNTRFNIKEIIYISNKLDLILAAISKGICCIGYDNSSNLFNPKIKNIILDLSCISYMYLNTVLSHHNNEPATIFNDKDILIRELSTNDFDSIYEMFNCETLDNTNYLSSYMTQDYNTEKDKFQKYILTQYEFYGYGQYIIFSNLHKEIIGQCGFYEDNLGNIALSYYIKPKYRNMGLAYKSCSLLIEYATNELFFEEIYAHINDTNLSSINLITKLNFKKTDHCTYVLKIQETV